jgi:hypothetical protein
VRRPQFAFGWVSERLLLYVARFPRFGCSAQRDLVIELQEGRPLADYKFATGDKVALMTNSSNVNVRPGIYTIVRRMPVSSQGCQYRAKSALDNHERVVDEAQLRRA